MLSYYPHFIPYFNELLWDRKRAYTVLADSSLVLDENHWYMRRYLRKHPEVVFEPDAPMAGTLLVRVEFYVGLFFQSLPLAAGELRAGGPWRTGTSCSG